MEEEIIIVEKFEPTGIGYTAKWGSIRGVGQTHVEALKALHYSMNFFNGSIERPTGLNPENIRFTDLCDDISCICRKANNP